MALAAGAGAGVRADDGGAGETTGAGDDPVEIHACPGPDGDVVFQTDPCPPVPAVPRAPAASRPAAERSVPRSEAGQAAGSPRSSARRPAASPRRAGSAPFVVLPRAAVAEPPPAAAPSRPSDPRYASPEATWRTFAAAMRAGDRDGALGCLTATALDELRPPVASAPAAELRATVDAVGDVASAGAAGPFWSLRAARPGAPPRWIFLERLPTGDWKISAF